VSGLVKRAPLDAAALASFAAAVAVAGAAGALGWRRTFRGAARPAGRFPRAAPLAAATSWYTASAVVIAAYYQFLQTQQWLWYFAPAVLAGMVLLVVAVADVTAAAGSGRSALAVGGLVFVLPLAAGCVVQVRDFTDATVRSIQLADRDAGVWIDAHLPADAVLASWDAGVVGYFSHRRVVNVDGVVNSHAWHDAVVAGTAGAVLRCEGVGWVVNHGPGATGDDAEIVALIGRVWGGPTELVHTVGYRYSGTSNAGGVELGGGASDQAVRLYRVDPARVGPRPAETCPPR
jgi:hypothetical protein